jgi:hypothetical protein
MLQGNEETPKSRKCPAQLGSVLLKCGLCIVNQSNKKKIIFVILPITCMPNVIKINFF